MSTKTHSQKIGPIAARAMVIHDRVLLAAEDRPAPGEFRSLKGAA